MKTKIIIFIPFILFLFLYSCKNDSNTVTPVTNAASETWKSYADGDTVNGGSWYLYKKTDSSKTIAGQWKKIDSTYSVTCPFNEGPLSITIIDSTFLISFSSTGTATNSYLPPGFQTSPFLLKVSGMGTQNTAVGNYVVKFYATSWPDSLFGFWNANKQNGSGVTH